MSQPERDVTRRATGLVRRMEAAVEVVRAARLAVEARTLAIEALASPVEPRETDWEDLMRRLIRATPLTPGEQWREAQERRPVVPVDQPSDAEIFGARPDACPTCGGFRCDPASGRTCTTCNGLGSVAATATVDQHQEGAA